MRRAERRHGHVVGLQHDAVVLDILGGQQFADVGPAFVLDARLDVEAIQFPVGAGHAHQTLWAERMDRRRQPCRPGIVDEIAVFEIVVGVVVADEDVLDRRDRHAGGDQLAADAHAAIDHDRRVVDDQQIGRIGSADADARATLGAEEHDARARLRGLRVHAGRREQGGAAERQF